VSAIKEAIKASRSTYPLTDGRLTDWDSAVRESERLRDAGVSDEVVETLTGVSPLRRWDFDWSRPRQKHLEAIATQAMNLALMMRDEDPQLVWDVLARLDDHQVRELAAVALAAMPVEGRLSEVFEWVTV
jgi:hypothetical protein